MENRRLMLVGGAITLTAVLAVCSFVVVSSATSLADAAARPLAVEPVVVPAPTATPTELPSTTAVPTPEPTPVTVPAPAPEDVTVRSPTSGQAAQSTTTTPAADDTSGATSSDDWSDGWTRAREWAQSQGWDDARIEKWLQKMHDRYESEQNWSEDTPATDAGTPSESESPQHRHGSKREQSPSPETGG